VVNLRKPVLGTSGSGKTRLTHVVDFSSLSHTALRLFKGVFIHLNRLVKDSAILWIQIVNNAFCFSVSKKWE
jgi:hypothetical protein